jgi:hypothetical protein
MSPSCPANTYTIPFDPVYNGPGEFATTKEMFNCHQFEKKRGSRTTPYPTFVSMYQRSDHCVVDGDMFEDLYLADMVDANKRWERVRALFDIALTLLLRASCHCLRDDSFVPKNLRGLLE